LIRTLAQANPLWRAPRIHGELKKLGIEVSERTVSRILQTVKRPPSQTWKTFPQNHVGEIVALDFFTVPTICLRVLFVFLVIEHRRRRVLHFGSPNIQPPNGPVSKLSKPFLNAMRSVTSFATVIRSMATSFVVASSLGYEGSRHRTPQSLAKCICGEADRLDSAGVFGPRSGPQSAAPSASTEGLLRLLSVVAQAHTVVLFSLGSTGGLAAAAAFWEQAPTRKQLSNSHTG
jgi:hypothetical protein